MADIMQSNIDLLRSLLAERSGYAGCDELRAWMDTDACDWAA